jgi:hypothetical protein
MGLDSEAHHIILSGYVNGIIPNHLAEDHNIDGPETDGERVMRLD